MLDVHPAHHAATTWRDFFIHIATIVLGLLIAIGLEQTVEFIHIRHEVNETRRALHTERLMNINRFAVITAASRRVVPNLQRNLAIFVYLRQHPNAPPSLWPGQLNWWNVTFLPLEAAWSTAQQNNVLPHMPPAEVRTDTILYRDLQLLNESLLTERAAIEEARRFAIVDPDPSHLTAAQLDREIDLTAQAIQDFATTANGQLNMNSRSPDFAPAPTLSEVVAIRHAQEDPASVGESHRLIQGVNDYEKSLSAEGTAP